MEGKGLPTSCLLVSEPRDSLFDMYFGISCAFYALQKLPDQALDVKNYEQSEILNKLEAAERELIELKKIRSEDGKANEKVARIYAAQEQNWSVERRKLRQQVETLLNDMRILDRRKSETISELNRKVQEMEFSVKSRDKILEEMEKKRKELEEKVKSMEVALEELRETTKREAEEHSSELLKHKTAFIELVSTQRQLEADLGRALRQVEATKEELDFVFDEKEEAILMVQELSVEIEKSRKDSEQKDRILSSMMQTSKVNFAERQSLLNEAKSSKLRRNKSDIHVSGSRNGRSLRNMLSRQNSCRLEAICDARQCNSVAVVLLDFDRTKVDHKDSANGDLGTKIIKEREGYTLSSKENFLNKCSEFDDAVQLDEWIRVETERYLRALEQRHKLELDSFSEKIQMKDDKIEAYRWRLFSDELESKRLQSQIESLNQDMSKLRHDNLKLESLLQNREVEIKTLKDQISLQLNHFSSGKTKQHLSNYEPGQSEDTVWSNVKLVKKKPDDKEKTRKILQAIEAKKEEKPETVSFLCVLSSNESIEGKDVLPQSQPACIEMLSPEGMIATGKEEAVIPCLNKRNMSTWKVDLHALGISYKIKRLNQQLLMLDRLSEKKETAGIIETDEHGQTKMKGFSLLLSLLNKQVSRYQSLQEKTDDLSKRMGEKDLDLKRGVSNSRRTKEETRKLEQFLEQTFQLQRFIVATGQKLREIQSKMSTDFVGIADELAKGSGSFDMKRFSDTIQSLFKDVQRGIEVRLSRIIGDLGGTLACDGIHFMK